MGLQEIYKKKFIPVSYYLYYYQDLFNLEYEVITKKFEINNDSIKKYLKDIVNNHTLKGMAS